MVNSINIIDIYDMQKYITNRKYIISKMVYNLANERKERIMLTEKRVHELKVFAEEIVGTRNSRRVLVERTRLEQEGSREERRIQYVLDFHSSYDLIGLVSQLDAEYDGSGFGVGAQVHAAQRRRGAFARYVGIESVVFLPQIEVFARYAQREVAQPRAFFPQIERVGERDVFQSQIRSVVNHEVAR